MRLERHTMALLAYLDARERHSDWLRFTNNVADWAPLVSAFLGGGVGIAAIAAATASIHNERASTASSPCRSRIGALCIADPGTCHRV